MGSLVVPLGELLKVLQQSVISKGSKQNPFINLKDHLVVYLGGTLKGSM